MKACDLQAIAVLDKVLRDHEHPEPAWCAARERNLIIAGDCTGHADSCFCTMLGGRPHPEALFDLNLSPIEDGYLVEAGSGRGEALLVDRERIADHGKPCNIRRIVGVSADTDEQLARARGKHQFSQAGRERNDALGCRGPSRCYRRLGGRAGKKGRQNCDQES